VAAGHVHASGITDRHNDVATTQYCGQPFRLAVLFFSTKLIFYIISPEVRTEFIRIHCGSTSLNRISRLLAETLFIKDFQDSYRTTVVKYFT
jgi:hypothetical protein